MASAWAQALDVLAPMRDGAKLAATVFRPARGDRFPVLLQRTPYGRARALTPGLKSFVDRGYAVVSQDVRGRGGSGGAFQPFLQEENDGEDTLNWLVKQPWCDGRIGMFGSSYAGITQWRAAISGHPALKAIAPVVAGADEYLDRFYSRGGALRLGHRLQWILENLHLPNHPAPSFDALMRHMPLRTADRVATGQTVDIWQMALDHPAYDDFWSRRSARARIERMRAAALIVTGFYDPAVESDLQMFQLLREAGKPARLLAGQWGHNPSTRMLDEDLGADARPALRLFEIAWFDTHVKGGGHETAGARYYLAGANEWRESAAWPPPGSTEMVFFLDPRKGLVDKPPRREAEQLFVYDPRQPVPTLGGALCCNLQLQPWGPADQRSLDTRADILRFASSPLKQPLTIAGRVQASLWVATDAPDTDFSAKLIDVSPAGPARLLTDGILRLRYREGITQTKPYRPTEAVQITIPMGVAAHTLKPGHRLRLDISSSNFPRFDRNPNTGRPIANETELRPARQIVFSGGTRASYVLAPILASPERP